MAHLAIGDKLALSRHTSHSPVLSSLYNPYAAMPSLHMAFAVIAGGSIAVYAKHRWVKLAGLVYPLYVAAEVVATRRVLRHCQCLTLSLRLRLLEHVFPQVLD
jgi:hypothetical protein